jgi:exonuclease VII small subunit
MSGPGDTDPRALDDAVDELERAAERLRAGDLEPDEAAALVERCAELAGRVGAELERTAREAAAEPPPREQESLL